MGSSNQAAEQIQLGREVADALATELTQKIAEKVSEQLARYFAQQGWINPNLAQ